MLDSAGAARQGFHTRPLLFARSFIFCTESDAESDTKSDEEEEIEDTPPTSPVDDKENIKQKFLVEMPEDFYEFWEFCKTEKSEQPTGKSNFY